MMGTIITVECRRQLRQASTIHSCNKLNQICLHVLSLYTVAVLIFAPTFENIGANIGAATVHILLLQRPLLCHLYLKQQRTF